MMKILLPSLTALSLVVLVTACSPADNPGDTTQAPLTAEQILEARLNYSLETLDLSIEERQVAGQTTASGEARATSMVASAAEGDDLEEGAEEISEGPRTVNVLIDLIVMFEGDGPPLPGITVELRHADSSDQEKARYLHWVEGLSPEEGGTVQVPIQLEANNYEDGDAFSMEIAEFVAAERRGEYREFMAAN
ncbi:MAG: hypothetical protein AAF604_02535 [Acidobacteriota bacterium]